MSLSSNKIWSLSQEVHRCLVNLVLSSIFLEDLSQCKVLSYHRTYAFCSIRFAFLNFQNLLLDSRNYPSLFFHFLKITPILNRMYQNLCFRLKNLCGFRFSESERSSICGATKFCQFLVVLIKKKVTESRN